MSFSKYLPLDYSLALSSLGYLININGNNIAVNSDGIYEIKREKGYDIFQKIVAGENHIWWNGDYDIDILLIQNRGEPGWI